MASQALKLKMATASTAFGWWRIRPGAVAYVAAGWAFLFAAPHLYWGAGGRFGLRWSLAVRGQKEEELIRDPGFIASGLWGVAALCLLAGLIALATVQPWGRRIPRRVRLVGAWGVCVVLALRAFLYPGFLFSGLRVLGIVGISEQADPMWFRWDLVLWSPWFLVGSIVFGAAARSLRRHNGSIPR